jgi:hypothetical protein
MSAAGNSGGFAIANISPNFPKAEDTPIGEAKPPTYATKPSLTNKIAAKLSTHA